MTRTPTLYTIVCACFLSACGEHSNSLETSSQSSNTLNQNLELQGPALGEFTYECPSDSLMTCLQLCYPLQPSPGPDERCCQGTRKTTCELEGLVTPSDRDNDGLVDTLDNCPGTPNPQQENRDGDTFGDVCDNCPDFASPDLSDRNANSQGDVCEDWDGDSVINGVDNCPDHFNPDQQDVDGDGQGPICDLNGDAPTLSAHALSIQPSTICSQTYDRINDCLNEKAPLPPSINRGISRGDDFYLPGSDYFTYRLPIDDTIYTRPVSLDGIGAHLDTPQVGQTQALPAERSTSDGRVILQGDNLLVYRPEITGKQQRIIRDDVSAISDRIHSYGMDLIPLFFGESDDKKYKGAFESTSGSTICERVENNPRNCQVQSMYGSTVTGDCYDITYMIPGKQLLNQNGPPVNNVPQSLFSADMTIFVRNPKTPQNPMSTDAAHITQTGAKDRVLRWREDLSPDGVVLEDSNKFTESVFPTIKKHGLKFTTDCSCKCNDSTCNSSTCDNLYDFKSLTEMTTTADGTLLIVNGNGLSYAIADDDQLGCQADQFTLFKPLSCFPIDPNASDYKLAQNVRTTPEGTRAFYNTQGEPIEPGSIVYGAYPWIDRSGSNILYTDVLNFRDAWKALSQRPEAFNPPGNNSSANKQVENYPDQSNISKGNGVVALGAWTQGKVVVLDNLLNATDWTGGTSPLDKTPQGGANMFYNFEMPLYQTAPRWVRPAPVSLINSHENRFNYFESHTPTLPFDVVWTFATNHNQNSEVAFDEYMLNNAFVVAHMNAPHTRIRQGEWNPHAALDVYSNYPDDGFFPLSENTPGGMNNMANYVLNQGGGLPGFQFQQNPKLQNASTSWPDRAPFDGGGPKHLRVLGGARVEPVALGGVQGKGVYLDGDNDFIDMGFYTPHHDEWFYGIWLDSREADPHVKRTVFFWPDESWIALDRTTLYAYNAHTKKTSRLTLADQGIMGTYFRTGEQALPAKYFHLGVKIHNVNGTQRLEVYINGTHTGQLDMADGAGFDLNYYEGWSWFVVSDPGPGFVSQGHEERLPWLGWIDEFRIYALDKHSTEHFDEFICNLAMGSLMLKDGKEFCEQLDLDAKGHPVDIPQQNGLKCADKAHQFNADPACLRTQKLALVDIHSTQPRPDFRSNDFCQTCHINTHNMHELDIAHALLGIDPVSLVNPPTGTSTVLPNSEDDIRRQPMFWPLYIHGANPRAPISTSHPQYSAGTSTLDTYLYNTSTKL